MRFKYVCRLVFVFLMCKNYENERRMSNEYGENVLESDKNVLESDMGEVLMDSHILSPLSTSKQSAVGESLIDFGSGETIGSDARLKSDKMLELLNSIQQQVSLLRHEVAHLETKL